MSDITAREQSQTSPQETHQSRPAQPSLFAGYGGGKEMPLGGYAVIAGLYGAAFAGFLLTAKKADRPLPERIGLKDILLLGVATHKVSRLITKDWVTSPLRAPFTEYQGTAGAGEVKEKARGQGLQRALGDLFT